MPTINDITHKLANKKIFTIIDMKDGYHNIKLDDESSKICTFATPFGRYKYLRMPFGISSAPEVFQKRVEAAFKDIKDIYIVADDIIIAAETHNKHNDILKKTLETARKENIKFNRNKIQLCKNEVKYLGSIISNVGMKPDPEKIEAITNMPRPMNRSDVKRLLGLINYLSPYIPQVSDITTSLRNLTKYNTQWTWNHEHEAAIKKISEGPVLKYFECNKPTVIQADASKDGLGACLLQNGHPITYTSRALTHTETGYSQIEKEMLALVYACEKFEKYIYGQTVIVHTDHKPLLGLVRKPIEKISPRLQKLLLRLMKYSYQLEYVQGKDLKIADTLSRAAERKVGNIKELEDYEEVYEISSEVQMSEKWKNRIKEENNKDEVCKILISTIQQGWPQNKKECKLQARQYWGIKEELFEAGGIIFREERVLIPKTLQQEILELLHESHLGVEKVKTRARRIIYWPGMTRDIQDYISKCKICAAHKRKNTKEPLLSHEIPHRPWKKVGADIFEFKCNPYLVVIDYFSKYPEVSLMKDKTSRSVINSFKSIFARHGIPEEVVADNMPFGSWEFGAFAKQWKFKLTTSSPRYPRSNGQSERTVQTVKQMFIKSLEDAKDPYTALLEFRSSPISGMEYSPAELLMSRQLNTKLPTKEALLEPKVVLNAKQLLDHRQREQKKYHDRKAGGILPEMEPGENVMLRNSDTDRWESAHIWSKHSSPRSYLVKKGNGNLVRRNRSDLRKTAVEFRDQERDESEEEEYVKQTEKHEDESYNKQEDGSDNKHQKVERNKMSSVGQREIKPPARYKDYV